MQENDFQVDHTEDATAFRDAVLSHYDAVVFLSTTGDVLNATQQAAFERYIQAGGGYAGIHAAADTEYDWNWYGHLVGGYFLSHPPGDAAPRTVARRGRARPLDRGPPGPAGPRWTSGTTTARPTTRTRTSRTATTARATAASTCSLTLDESTYDEEDGNDPVADDHPISWCQRYDGGRSWYTGMGHTEASFSEQPYLQHLLGGIETAAGCPGPEGCDPPNEDPAVQASADPRTGTAPLTVALLGQRLRRGRRPAGVRVGLRRRRDVASARTRTTRTWRPARTRRR